MVQIVWNIFNEKLYAAYDMHKLLKIDNSAMLTPYDSLCVYGSMTG